MKIKVNTFLRAIYASNFVLEINVSFWVSYLGKENTCRFMFELAQRSYYDYKVCTLFNISLFI